MLVYVPVSDDLIVCRCWVFSTKLASQYGFLSYFLGTTMPQITDLVQKREIFAAFLDFAAANKFSAWCVHMLQRLVIPLVEELVKRSEGAQFMQPVRCSPVNYVVWFQSLPAADLRLTLEIRSC